VLFVGAGPGDPELITVKGRRALAAADLVVYAGSLVPAALLKWTRPGTAAVDSAALSLEEIVALMAEAHRAGKRVVRLHTGDPSLYGAIAEQMAELKRLGIAGRIIPGVTAAFAAAAALGIEFTQPELTQTLILTRAAGRTPVPAAEALAGLAAHRASMAIYLSMGQVAEVAEALSREFGPEAPCAVVYRASHPDEKIVRTRLVELPARVREEGIGRQAVIVVGRVLEAAALAAPRRSKLYDKDFVHGFRGAGPLPGQAPAGPPADDPPYRARTGAARTAIWAVTAAGAALGRKIAPALPGAEVFVLEKYAAAAPGAATFRRLVSAVSGRFHAFNGHVFITAAGIAVRAIAGRIRHKTRDPAVVVMDERGRHAVSLLSGHLGGANALARQAAAAAGAVPVITTATDVNALPSIDGLARELGLAIENPSAVKRVNAALLSGEVLRVHDPGGWLAGRLPKAATVRLGPARAQRPAAAAADLVVDDCRLAAAPQALVLRPPTLIAGIGCNRGTPQEEIGALLSGVLASAGLSALSLARIASIDLKSEEAGLLGLAQSLGVPIEFFKRNEIRRVEGGVPTPSARVEKHVGVKSVCEAAAILAARGGALIVPKRATRNVTVAIARIPTGAGSMSSGSDPGTPST
jgi:precorrin-4/cobalt-precorrin-4 C11-methyltransferase